MPAELADADPAVTTTGSRDEPVADGRMISPGRAFALTAFIAAFVIAADQLSKELALSQLKLGDPVDVFWKLRLNLIFNSGSAFSLGESLGPIIGVVAILVSGVLLWFSRTLQTRRAGIFLGLIVGGALGNVIDRLLRGHVDDGFMAGAVIDFVDFQFWPVFNLADSAIVVGAILMVLFGTRDGSGTSS